jgi:hypothetical protein
VVSHVQRCGWLARWLLALLVLACLAYGENHGVNNSLAEREQPISAGNCAGRFGSFNGWLFDGHGQGPCGLGAPTVPTRAAMADEAHVPAYPGSDRAASAASPLHTR